MMEYSFYLKLCAAADRTLRSTSSLSSLSSATPPLLTPIPSHPPLLPSMSLGTKKSCCDCLTLIIPALSYPQPLSFLIDSVGTKKSCCDCLTLIIEKLCEGGSEYTHYDEDHHMHLMVKRKDNGKSKSRDDCDRWVWWLTFIDYLVIIPWWFSILW